MIYQLYKTYPLLALKTDILIGLKILAVTGKDAGKLNKKLQGRIFLRTKFRMIN